MSLAADSPPIRGLDLAGTRMTPEEFDAVEERDEGDRSELIGELLGRPAARSATSVCRGDARIG